MFNLVDYIDSAFLDSIALTLVHFLWQGLAIGAAAWFVLRVLLRSASAKTRHAFCVGSLLLLAACPVVTFTTLDRSSASLTTMQVVTEETFLVAESPDSSSETAAASNPLKGEAPRVEFESTPIQSESEAEFLDTTPTPPAAEPPDEPLASNDTSIIAEPAPRAFEEPTVPAVSPVEAESTPARGAWSGFAPYISTAYLMGVALMLARLALALQGGRRLRRDSTPVEDSALLAVVGERAAAMGLAFTPAVAYCARIAVPTVVGVLRPMILLPASINTGLSISQLELLLSHEIAHIRRYDHLINMLQRCIEALLFFHPAVWFISRQISIERENCCDDLVLRSGGEAHAYAESLVNAAAMGKGRTLPSPATLGATDKPSQLRNRINRMLGSPTPKLGLTRVGVIASLLAGTLAVVALYEVTRYQRAEPDRQEKEVAADETGLDSNALEGEAAELAGQLADETDWWLRQVAAQKMGESGDARFVPFLINALGDKDYRVVVAVADSLGEIGDPAAIGQLMGVTRMVGERAHRAALALSKIEDPRVQEYVDLALADTSEEVRMGAYRVLGVLNTDEGVETLVTRGLGEEFLWSVSNNDRHNFRKSMEEYAFSPKILADLPPERYMDILMSRLEEDKESIEGGAAMLGRYIGGSDGLRILTSLVDVKDYKAKMAVLNGLGDFGAPAAIEPLVSLMRDENLRIVESAAENLKKVGYSPETPEDSAAYFVALRNWEVAATFGEAAIAPLVKALASEDTNYRMEAVATLGVLGDPQAIEPLSQLLNDAERDVRLEVIESLKTIGGPDAVMPMTRALRDSNAAIRRSAAEWLGQFGDSRAILALSASLKDMDGRVGYLAVEGLRNIGGTEALDVLIGSLSSNPKYLAQYSAYHLGALGDTRAIEPLAILFEQGLQGVDQGALREAREAAALSLAQLGDSRSIEFLRLQGVEGHDQHDAKNILEALATLRTNAAYSAMIEIVSIRGGSYDIANHAVDVLAEDASPGAVDALAKIALDASPSIGSDSRKNATAALGRIGDTRAIEPLRELFQSYLATGAVKRAVRTAIKNLGGADPAIETPQVSRTTVIQAPPKTSASTDAAPEPVTVTKTVQTASQPAWTPPRDGAAALAFDPRSSELMTQLGDGDWWLRKIAVQQLTELGEELRGEPVIRTHLARSIIPLLNDGDTRVRQAAAEALGALADPVAIKHLVAALQNTNASVQYAVVGALAKFDSPEIVEYLRLALDEGQLNNVMPIAAVRALVARKREGTLSALVHATGGAARSEAIEALKNYDAVEVETEMLKGFEEKNFNEKRLIADALGRIGIVRGREILAELADESAGENRVYIAIDLVELGDPRAAVILIQSLSDPAMDVRKQAAEKLREINHLPESRTDQANYFVALEDWDHVAGLGADAIEPLIDYLNATELSPGKKSRRTARSRAAQQVAQPMDQFLALAEIKDAKTIPALARMLGHHLSDYRGQTVNVLEAIGDAAAVPALELALQDVDARVRKEAVDALYTFGPEAALNPLLKATRDVDEEVRYTAAARLGELGDLRAVEPLAELLADVSGNVVDFAAKSLAALGPEAFEAIVKVYPRVTERSRVIEHTMPKMGSQAIDFLIAELNSADVSTARSAAYALSEIEDARAVEALSQMALNFLAEEDIRSTAIHFLGNVGNETARRTLLTLFDDATFGSHAARALSENVDKAIYEMLTKWLEDNPDADTDHRSRVMSQLNGFRSANPVPPRTRRRFAPAQAPDLSESILQRTDKGKRGLVLAKLREMLAPSTSDAKKRSALIALTKSLPAKFNRDPFRPLVLPLLKSEIPDIRALALGCLPQLDATTKDLAHIIPMAKDTSAKVREGVAAALIQVGGGKESERVVPALIKLLQDSESKVVVRTLRSMWGQYSTSELDKLLIALSREPKTLGYAVYHSLSTMPSKSVAVCQRLVEVLDVSDWNDSGRAAWGLQRGVVPEARRLVEDGLLKALPEETNESVRKSEFDALRNVATEKSRPYLSSVVDSELESDEFKQRARKILAALDAKSTQS